MRNYFSPVASAGLLVALVGLGLPPSLQAQYPYYDGYDGGYHASTAAEGYARGMSEAIRAQGDKNLRDAQAADIGEDARSKYIDNRLKATEAYWERKKIYDQNMAEQRYAEAQVRREHRARNMLGPITNSDLDPTTGEVHWPMICRDDQYAEYREPLTQLFEKRGAQGELSTAEYMQAKQLIDDFHSAIHANKDTYPKKPLSQSLRFLLKLNRELESSFS